MATPATDTTLAARVERLHAFGVVDMHFDLLMDLYERRGRAGLLDADYLPELRAGGVGVLGVAIYIEDRYLPEMALRVALGQVARLHAETDRSAHFVVCTSHDDIAAARRSEQIALLITME